MCKHVVYTSIVNMYGDQDESPEQTILFLDTFCNLTELK